jgi:ribonuclease-3
MRSGGREKVAILGDACEALIGAVFLDADYATARDVVWRGFAERIGTLAKPVADSKTILQEWAQGRGLPVPNYRETGRTGPDHKPEFVIAVEIEGFAPCSGSGASKRLAEQAAARAFMERESVSMTQDTAEAAS